jgi:hypothetical protein
MTQTSEFGGKSGFGQSGAPGALSPFDTQAAQMGANQSMTGMANRYAQLGLSSQGATPTSPGGPAGGVGVGGGANFNNNNGAGMPTAELMDLGMAPSLVGGIPAEFEAMLGQLQTQDLAQTSQMANSGGGKGGGKGGAGGLASLGKMAAK